MSFFRVLFLSPLAFFYKIITEIRNKLYDWGILKSTEFDIPIISMGNLRVGGTGKTPHTEYLIQLLSEKNYKVAVLSRGYKRKSKGFYAANPESNAENLGDELFQIYKKFPQLGVFACNDRVEGVKRILNEKEKYEVILLDDAYQHRSIKPGFSVLLNDFNHPFYEDHMLPLGRLREILRNKKRAQTIIISKCPKDLTPIDQRIIRTKIQSPIDQSNYFSTVNYENIQPVFKKNRKEENFSTFLQFYQNILLVTGIANNAELIKQIKNEGKNVEVLKFPDHHSYTKIDMQKIATVYEQMKDSKVVLTTEKDAVRLLKFKDEKIRIKNYIYYITIKINFLKKEEQESFNLQIIKYVESNRRKF